MASKGTIGPKGLAYIMAHQPAGADTNEVLTDWERRGYKINIPGYHPIGTPAAAAAPSSGPPGLQGQALDALTAAAPGAGIGEFVRQHPVQSLIGAEGLYAAGRFANDIGQSRTLKAVKEIGHEELMAHPGLAGVATRVATRVAGAREQPRMAQGLDFAPGRSVGQVPTNLLPPPETAPPRPTLSLIEGTGGGGAETIPTRPITVEGQPARAPAQTKTYKGGRGKSGPKLAETTRQLEAVSRGEPVVAAGPPAQPGAPSKFAAALEDVQQHETVPSGAKPVSFGKNGNVIGELGDEARVAGRAATSVDDLIARATRLARKVPKSARQALFKTVRAASKFANEADTFLPEVGGAGFVPDPNLSNHDNLVNGLLQVFGQGAKHYSPEEYRKAAEAILQGGR